MNNKEYVFGLYLLASCDVVAFVAELPVRCACLSPGFCVRDCSEFMN